MLESFKSRKFILSVIGIVALFVLVLTKNIDAKEFVLFLTTQIGLYQLANTIESLK
jgi:hypothetical protein